LLVVLCLAPMAMISWRAAGRWWDRRSGAEVQAGLSPDAARDWRATCAWIERQTPAKSRFITPPAQQCFRWHGERSEVASWKDIPQSAADIVEWRERIRNLRTWWAALRRHGPTPAVERRLYQLAEAYEAQYIIVPHALYARPLPLTPVYASPAAGESPSRGYTVYWIPPREG
jgi:hypothetical protein